MITELPNNSSSYEDEHITVSRDSIPTLTERLSAIETQKLNKHIEYSRYDQKFHKQDSSEGFFSFLKFSSKKAEKAHG